MDFWIKIVFETLGVKANLWNGFTMIQFIKQNYAHVNMTHVWKDVNEYVGMQM